MDDQITALENQLKEAQRELTYYMDKAYEDIYEIKLWLYADSVTIKDPSIYEYHDKKLDFWRREIQKIQNG